MGEVYRARERGSVATSRSRSCRRFRRRSRTRAARFEREARALAALNHPNIAAIYDGSRATAQPALVLELVEGETLAERIAGTGRCRSIDEPLTIARQIADALDAAHEAGIVHRDLKPGNIKITDDGRVKVLDFGLAKAIAVARARRPSSMRRIRRRSPCMAPDTA